MGNINIADTFLYLTNIFCGSGIMSKERECLPVIIQPEVSSVLAQTIKSSIQLGAYLKELVSENEASQIHSVESENKY